VSAAGPASAPRLHRILRARSPLLRRPEYRHLALVIINEAVQRLEIPILPSGTLSSLISKLRE